MADPAPGPPLCLSGPYAPRVDSAGRGRRQPAVVRRRPLVDYLLTTMLSGAAELTLDGATHAVPEGATLIVPPGRPFGVRFAGTVELAFVHCSVIHDPGWVAFDHRNAFDITLPGRAAFLQPGPERVWGLDLPPVAPRRLQPRLRRELPALVDLWCSGGHAATFAAYARLAALLAAIVEAVRPPDRDVVGMEPEERVALAETVARRHAGIGLTVDDLAAAAGYARTHFSELFARLRGESPGGFLRRLVLEEARSRLLVAEEPLGGLARDLGFADAATFARAFRRAYGLPPARWRMQQGRGASEVGQATSLVRPKG